MFTFTHIHYSEKSPAEWFISLSIGRDEVGQKLKITQGDGYQRMELPSQPPYNGHGLRSCNFNISGTHSKHVENFTKLSFNSINEDLNDIVNHFCKAAGAEDHHRRTYSFDKQGDLIINFGCKSVLR